MSGSHLIPVILVVALSTLPCAAFCVVVPTLPFPEYADTEVSTNIPFVVDIGTISRIEFSLSLDASPTNSVEVAIGTDSDGDGNLSVWEASHTFGYDCGRWFRRFAEDDSETVETDNHGQTVLVISGHEERTFFLKKRRLDESWTLVKVTRRGSGDVGEVVMVEGKRPGFALEVR